MGNLKDDGDGRADIDLAFQPDAGVVDAGNVLDDGQPQPGAASGLAPALIDPVEALEHAGLGFFRDADAVVLDGQGAVPIRAQAVMSWTFPPGRLYRMALSQRFWHSSSSRLRLPSTGRSREVRSGR